jgi:protocatechuate 3,4-dioxygenase alpha subunit
MTLGLTPSQTVGPYLHIGLPDVQPGGAVVIRGRVLDGAGEALPDATVELWHGDGIFGRSDTRAGRFELVVSKPSGSDGRAPHFAVSVFARGLLQRVVTRMYFPDEAETNAADPVLAAVPAERRETLVAVAEPDGSLLFDIRLQGDGETVFFEP